LAALPPDTLLLWDIDGTLLTTARAGIRAWEDAVQSVLGPEVDLSTFPTAGLTDWMIARDLVREHGGRDTSDDLEWRLIAAYTAALPERLAQKRGRVLPNVVEVLAALAATGRVVHTLLTGNARAGAAAKLASYGLDRWFTEGGFCDDGFDRATIGRAAIDRVAVAVAPITLERTVVVGDTPLDVQCGHALGVRTIAVATGEYGVEELALHDPWRVVAHLPEPAEVLELLGLAGER
jgi:phosphoglycolate phosphatase-like HAD superfamily hydrolase